MGNGFLQCSGLGFRAGQAAVIFADGGAFFIESEPVVGLIDPMTPMTPMLYVLQRCNQISLVVSQARQQLWRGRTRACPLQLVIALKAQG